MKNYKHLSSEDLKTLAQYLHTIKHLCNKADKLVQQSLIKEMHNDGDWTDDLD